MKRREETVVEEILEEEVPATEEKEQKNEKEVEEITEPEVVENEPEVTLEPIAEVKSEEEQETSELFIKIDEMRKNYLKSAKLIKYLSYGIMIPVLIACLVGVFFLNGDKVEDWVKYTVIGVVIAAAIGLIVFKVLTKRYVDKKANNYVSNYYTVTSTYMLEGEEFSDVVVNPKGKVKKEFFTNAGIYQDLRSVGSRNLVTFKHNGREFSFVDLAASVQGAKKLEPIFVGKVLKYTLTKEVNGRLLGQILGNNKLSKPIDGFAGLEQISKTANYVFYSDMHKERNILTKSVTDLLGKYHLNNDLLDVVIAIKGNEILIGLDYNDPVMQLPVEKKFNKNQIDDIKAALFNSISIIEAIAEKLEK